MRRILVVIDEPFTDPVRGCSYPSGLAEIEERYEKRSRLHGLKFRYPTEEEAASFRARARAARKRGPQSLESSLPEGPNADADMTPGSSPGPSPTSDPTPIT